MSAAVSLPRCQMSGATSLQEATGAFKEMARRALQERKKREEENKKPHPADWPMPQDVLKQYLLTQASSIRDQNFPHAGQQQRHSSGITDTCGCSFIAAVAMVFSQLALSDVLPAVCMLESYTST